MEQKDVIRDFGDVELKKSKISQFEDGLGIFAKRAFKKGEVVIQWDLKTLTEEQYQMLPLYEKENFCHKRYSNIYYYLEPERHVNRSPNPNVFPDFEKEVNIALRDIEEGEELSILDVIKEDFE